MATETIEKRVIISAQYEALVRPTSPVTAEELFEYQVASLVDKKLARREDADPFRSKLPADGKLFLFMPPQPNVLDFSDLMARIELNGKTGVNYLNVKHLKDLIRVLTGAHLLVNVEDGDARRNITPRVSRKKIKKDGREPYTTFRGIIHAIVFPYVLSHHFLDLVGSRYSSTFAPRLFLNDSAQPTLFYNFEDFADPKWGAPSCGGVVGA